MLKNSSKAIGAVLLVLLGSMTTTSPKVATSNVGGWLAWFGVDRVPAFLASAATDRIIQIGIAVILAVFATSWWHRHPVSASMSKTYKSDADQLDDWELGDRMDTLSYQLRQYGDHGWYRGNETIQDVMIAVESLRITLVKQGVPTPFVPVHSDPMSALGIYDRYFTIVGKLLREGHAAEAREWAKQFADNKMGSGQSPSELGSG
jgi:hypothetical protein